MSKKILVAFIACFLLSVPMVYSKPTCKSVKTCQKSPYPGGCQIQFEVFQCDDTLWSKNPKCHTGQSCVADCCCECNPDGYLITWTNTCTTPFSVKSDAFYCTGC